MDGWKTKLEVTENGQISTSRIMRMKKEYLQGDSYSPLGFCFTEVPVAMLIEDTEGYIMGKKNEPRVKRKHSLFVDDRQGMDMALKICDMQCPLPHYLSLDVL